MNKYKTLAKNTAIFAIGTFSSKVLSFIMVFFYSRVMQTAEFGLLDIVINSASLLLPVAMLGITNAIIRFGVDRDFKKSDVFTSAIIAVGIGFSVLLIFMPLILMINDLRRYIVVLYAHILVSSIRHICSFFVRANNKLRLFAVDGVFSTFMTCLLTIIFLVPFKMGIVGYVLAIIIADLCSVSFLMAGSKLYKYIDFKNLDTSLTKKMIHFAIPLIPTSLLWWVVNVSDRYFIKYMINDSTNGLYAAAYKVPTILTLISNIFLDAWQLSAVSENKSLVRNRFYSNIFKSFEGCVCVVSSGLILFSKFITYVLLAPSYYLSWNFIPVLLLSTVFSCFVVFLGNIYLAQTRSVASLFTTVIGAVLNIILNFFLIKQYGAQGAAISTCISYFVVFIARGIDIKLRNRDITFSSRTVFLNTLLLIGQTVFMVAEPRHWVVWQVLFFIVIAIVNIKSILALINKSIKR